MIRWGMIAALLVVGCGSGSGNDGGDAGAVDAPEADAPAADAAIADAAVADAAPADGAVADAVVARDAGALDGAPAADATAPDATPNTAPLGSADLYTVDEDQTLVVTAGAGVLANDDDPDGDTLSAVLVQDVTHGALSLAADGSFQYQPDANFNGADAFIYVATDGDLDSAETVVDLAVAAVDDPPVAADDAYLTSEGTDLVVNAASGVLANDTEIDGETLTAAIDTDPANGSVSLASNGSFTYTPDPGFDGVDSFTYAADDGTSTDVATVTITVSYAHDIAWAVRAGGSDDDTATAVATLPDGAVAVTGRFEGTATFGPGEVNETVLTAAGGADVFVARYEADGTLGWAVAVAGTANDDAGGIAAFDDGSVAVTGLFGGTATFGPGEVDETVLTAVDQDEVFVARFAGDGTLAWARAAGGTSDDRGNAIAVAGDDSVWVTGGFVDDVTFAAGLPAETTLTSNGGYDIFLARYGGDGSFDWARGIGSTSFDEGQGVGVLSDGSAIAVGYLRFATVFGAGEANETTVTPNGLDGFVARYAADGSLVYVFGVGAPSVGFDSAEAVAVHDDDTFAVTGYLSGAATFGAGEPQETTVSYAGGYDIFTAYYAANGSLVWARADGGADYDRGVAVAVAGDGSVVVTGHLQDVAVFGAGEPNEVTLTAAGSSNEDVAVARYTASGALAWAAVAGGGFRDFGRGVCVLPDGSPVVVGTFAGLASFAAGTASETVLSSAGFDDAFVARYLP